MTATIGASRKLPGILHDNGGAFINAMHRDYQVKGDNITDDAPAIQAVLDTGFPRIYLPPRVDPATGLPIPYYIAAPIKMATSRQELCGGGWGTKLRAAPGLFCAIAVIESTVRPVIRDLELQGAMTTEPAGPLPARGIVVGTNPSVTLHSLINWSCYALIENVHITGVIPGTNGFNEGLHFNKGNKNRARGLLIESLFGTNSSFGYGIGCDADDTDILDTLILSTIAGQGRHAIYFTNTPRNSRAINCYAEGFQSEAFTSNITPSGTNGYDLAYINCVARDCLQTSVGSSAGVFAFTNGRRGRAINCKALGSSKGSNVMGVTVADCPDSLVDNFFGENIYQHGVNVVGASQGTRVIRPTLREVSLASAGVYCGIELSGGSNHKVEDVDIVATSARAVVRYNASTPPSSSQVSGIRKSGAYVFEVENYRLDATNRTVLSDNAQRYLVLTDAATIVVVAQDARAFAVTLAGNRTMGAPTQLTIGERYSFTIIQDGTGGRTLAWNAIFKVSWSDAGNTLNKRSTIECVWDGTNLNQVGAQTPYV